MVDRPDIFDKIRLPPELDAFLRDANPWWVGSPGRVLPPFRRWAFSALLRKLESQVAPVTFHFILRGRFRLRSRGRFETVS